MKLSEPQIIEADGYKWWFHYGEDDHLALGGHETQLKPFFESLNDKNKVYINVGAHVGTWAIRASAWAKEVWAIEANPKTYKTLKDNVELNKLTSSVMPVLMAAWDDAKTPVTFVDVNGMATGGSTRLERSEGGMITNTIDNLVAEFAHYSDFEIGFISSDVEGAEAHVFRGAKETVAKYRPNLLIEVHTGHPGVDEDLEDQLNEFLAEQNYTISKIRLSPTAPYWICQPAELVEDYPSE